MHLVPMKSINLSPVYGFGSEDIHLPSDDVMGDMLEGILGILGILEILEILEILGEMAHV